MDITIVDNKLKDAVISYAENCSWGAGKELGEIAGFCTLTERDEMPPEYPFTPFVGFVFVDERYRGRRVSEKMIKSAIGYADEIGFEKVYIMSGEVGLYEKYGFTKIGDFETIYGGTEQLFEISTTI